MNLRGLRQTDRYILGTETERQRITGGGGRTDRLGALRDFYEHLRLQQVPHHPTRQDHLLSGSISIQGLKWGSPAEEGAPDGPAHWQDALSGATGAQDLAWLLLGLETGSAPVQGTKRTGSPMSTVSALT